MPKKPKASSNPATEAHTKDMDPELEAKRSGPPPTARTMPQPLADPDAGFEQSDEHAHAGVPVDQDAIEAKLKDPTFDPEGHERLRLAEQSRHAGSGEPYPPSSDVDERGDPMEPGERNPERMQD